MRFSIEFNKKVMAESRAILRIDGWRFADLQIGNCDRKRAFRIFIHMPDISNFYSSPEMYRKREKKLIQLNHK